MAPQFIRFSIGALLMSALGVSSARAELNASEPVGLIQMIIPAASDVRVGLPFHRPSIFQGTVEVIDGQTITLRENPQWPAQQFTTGDTRYYLRFDSGMREGQWGTIIANSSHSVTISLDDGSQDLNGIVSGEHFSIIPFWTPKSFFLTDLPVGIRLHLYDNNVPGVNQSPSNFIEYFGPLHSWLSQTDYITSMDHKVIPPGSGMVVRNSTSSPVTIVMSGNVPMAKHRMVLQSKTDGEWEHRVSYNSPVPESLVNIASGFETGDAFFFYNNASSGFNKSANRIYAFDQGVWYDEFTGLPISTEVLIQPGSSFAIRKFRTPEPGKFVWESIQSYLD